jgi:hypothetical protein
MVLLGYETGSKAYRLYDSWAQQVVVSRDVVFDKAASWDHGGVWQRGSADEWTEQLLHRRVLGVLRCKGAGPRRSTKSKGDIPYFGKGEAPSPPQSPAGEENTTAPPGTPAGIHFATPPPVISPHVDASYDGEPLRFHTVNDLVSDEGPPGQVAHVLDDLELHLGSAKEPSSFAAAM